MLLQLDRAQDQATMMKAEDLSYRICLDIFMNGKPRIDILSQAIPFHALWMPSNSLATVSSNHIMITDDTFNISPTDRASSPFDLIQAFLMEFMSTVSNENVVN
jgi:hypothetical protein